VLQERRARGLQLAGEELAGELLVLSDVGRHDPLDAPLVQQQPQAHSSTPQLFDITSRSRAPESRSARISTAGMPHNPKPLVCRALSSCV
jgi:hypothetical protein